MTDERLWSVQSPTRTPGPPAAINTFMPMGNLCTVCILCAWALHTHLETHIVSPCRLRPLETTKTAPSHHHIAIIFSGGIQVCQALCPPVAKGRGNRAFTTGRCSQKTQQGQTRDVRGGGRGLQGTEAQSQGQVSIQLHTPPTLKNQTLFGVSGNRSLPSVLFLIVKSCCHCHLHSVHNLKDPLGMLYNKYCLQTYHLPVALQPSRSFTICFNLGCIWDISISLCIVF